MRDKICKPLDIPAKLWLNRVDGVCATPPCEKPPLGKQKIQAEKEKIIMKKATRILSILLTCALALSVLALSTTAASVDPWEIPEHTKAYSATYEIIVDSWDYTEYEAGADQVVRALTPKTVQAKQPYVVGPLETTIYQLDNGNYWFNQLYQHSVELFPTYKFTGFNAARLISALLNDEYDYMYNTGLWRSAEFTVNGMFVPVVLVPLGDSMGAYADAFQLGTLPAQVQFTMTASDDIPGTYIGIPGSLPKIIDDYSFLFRGVIKFTNVKEIKPSPTIFGTKYESSFWNWFKFIVLFGWVWMWFI